MIDEQLYGLRKGEYQQVGRLVRGEKVITREQPTTGERDRSRYRGIARVILSESDAPVYTPKTKRTVSLFQYKPTGKQITIQFNGHQLEGDLVLTIDGKEMHVDSKATTDELRAALLSQEISLTDCRTTVFPGLWEFDFNFGRWKKQYPTFTCTAYEPPVDDDETPVFSGDLVITQEAFVSVTHDRDTVETIETTDWIPHHSGALTPGAIGAAQWCFAAGWMVLTWQCRDWSFAPDDPYDDGGA